MYRRLILLGAALVGSCALLFYPLSWLFGAVLAYTNGAVVARYPAVLERRFAIQHDVYLPYAALPECAVDGAVSVEDKRFFQHPGIDPFAIVRLALENLHNDHRDHGGSTITQQLARMIVAEPRHQATLLQELWSELRVIGYALVVEHDFSKHKILELYLNSAYYGRGADGLAQAAHAYFHTGLAKLPDGACYYLTGLVQAPSYYGRNPRAAENRYLHVLATLRRNGYIDRTQERRLRRSVGGGPGAPTIVR